MLRRVSAGAILSLFLAACGGGGGGSSSTPQQPAPPPPPPPPVEGGGNTGGETGGENGGETGGENEGGHETGGDEETEEEIPGGSTDPEDGAVAPPSDEETGGGSENGTSGSEGDTGATGGSEGDDTETGSELETEKEETEPEPVNQPPELVSPVSFSFNENVYVGIRLDVVDPDGDEVSISFPNQGDNARFRFDPRMQTIEARTSYSYLNFEEPIDSDEDNIYELTVVLSDGELQTSVVILIEILDVDEPPEFTHTRVLELHENQTGPIFQFSANDPEGGDVSGFRVHSVSKLGEAYNSARLMEAFSIDRVTGVLTVNVPFDAEIDGTVYPINIVVAASDGNLTGYGGLEIRLVDVVDRVVEGARIGGTSPAALLGDSLVSIGDLDGDGVEEFWIGERFVTGHANTQILRGWMIWGKTMRDLLADGSIDLTINDLSTD